MCQATLLFDRFLNHYHGLLVTVDLDPHACDVARGVTSNRTVVIQGACGVVGTGAAAGLAGRAVAVPHPTVWWCWCVPHAHTGDSVEALWSLNVTRPVDLVYLDSYDVQGTQDELSAEHHLKVRRLTEHA